MGISLYPADGNDVETLVRQADNAMYRAKEQGRNTYHLYSDALSVAAVEQMTLVNGLRNALDRDEFVLHYQPRVDIRTGEILGAEALVRWRHPDLGLVPPSQFIGLAEETGLIVPMSEWVMRTACAQNKEWQDAGLPPIGIAVNISTRQFQHKGLRKTVEKVLRETGLDSNYLDLELTESTLMQNPDLALQLLCKLKAMGVRVSIDDFGTGYSSLSYLKRFPIDAVKIDQSFVRDITSNPDDAAIAGAIVAMAHSLKLKVIAEGVETLEQLAFLRSLNCDEMQGYFVSRPVPSEEFRQLLEDARRPTAHRLLRAA
jgi:EAL domain-containing protein (putative c-di-GMP-specific phosphodiesterase class I)